jgi:hypothetical protein
MRRRKDRVNAIANRRKSVAYFPANQPRLLPHPERHMVTEDIYHAIMPTGHYGSGNNVYRVSVTPSSERVAACLEVALTSDERAYDLASAVSTFVTRAVTVILYDQEALFEVVFDKDANPRAFWLAPFPFGKVKTSRTVVRQMVPAEIQRERRLKHGYVEIPKGDVVRFSFPASLGGKQGVAKLLTGLERLRGLVPQFAESAYGRLGEVGVDSTAYYHLRQCAIGQVTARLGWPGRWLMDEKTTEIYSLFRQLKFRHSLALIREHVLEELNRAIGPALRRVGLEGQLVVSGLTTSQEAEARVKALLDGSLTFADARAYYREL